MSMREMICVVCPNGCLVKAEIEDGPVLKVVKVDGCLCEKGEQWAEQEIRDPVRTIASSVLVEGGDAPLVSVRTDAPIPLNKIFDVMAAIKAKTVDAPVSIGDPLLRNPAGVACNVIATRNVQRSTRQVGVAG
ncbi:MAG: DUF1667 domain-containing protein [Deltaproteobacteria bacterium]|nr:DUF1667 domain-containing protein [Deltaproteobacteria bacterium]